MNIKHVFDEEVEEIKAADENTSFVLIRHLDGHEAIYQFGLDSVGDDYVACSVVASNRPASSKFANVTFASICRWDFFSKDEFHNIYKEWEESHRPFIPTLSSSKAKSTRKDPSH